MTQRFQMTDRQRDTILAALRCYQQELSSQTPNPAFINIAADSGEEPLNLVEIDELCESLNH